MNTFGSKFRLTTYGESHGPAVGGIIDGCPANVRLDMDAIRADLDRRRAGAPRQEEDEIEWLSGLKNNITLGTPIAFCIRNKYARPDDYDLLADCYRPGHADYTYEKKYGLRDHRGGGRASARETVARVVAGAIAKQLLAPIEIHATASTQTIEQTDNQAIANDTVGGIVSCRITGLPAGVGDPVFGKLNAALASAMMSIPSAIGFEMGIGFQAAQMTGSQYIDRWNECFAPLRSQAVSPLEPGRNASMPDCLSKDAPATQTILPDRKGTALSTAEIKTNQAKKQSNNQTITKTNHCGGIQGGISNGMPVEFRVAFHPVATLPQPVECLTADGTLKTLQVKGRHDRCHVPRAAVVVEAMAALTIVNLCSTSVAGQIN